MANFAAIYAAFRGSKAFLVGLIAFTGIWLAWHFISGFDDGFGLLNTVLSIEASTSLAFFTMIGDQQSQAQARQTEALETAVAEILRVGTATLEVAKAQREVLADHSEELDALIRALQQEQAAAAVARSVT